MQNSNLAIYKTALETELRVSCRTFEMCKSAFVLCGVTLNIVSLDPFSRARPYLRSLPLGV
jgi:hypothetical protein